MPALSQLIDSLDRELDIAAFDDYGPNGLQVPGREQVERVVTGVSAVAELFERAAEREADLVVVHHGLFWDKAPRSIDTVMRTRLKLLFDNDIALAAYHLPLDAHLEHGNNALLARALGCEALAPFGSHGPRTLGVSGRFSGAGLSLEELVERVRATTAREPLVLGAGPDRVRSIGIVSGAAADHLGEAVAAGLDAFLTGEPAERSTALAREQGIHFIAAGHHATETLGVRALGELLAERFGVAHEFIDVPNPV